MTDIDLRSLIEPILNRKPHIEVVEALASLLGQAIADNADTAEEAACIVEGIGRAISRDIMKNWHLVEARRACQPPAAP